MQHCRYDGIVVYLCILHMYLRWGVNSIFKFISTGERLRNTKLFDKPNEDYIIFDDENKVYILADGVSRDKTKSGYPNPSPAKEVAELFSKSVYQHLLNSKEEDGYERVKNAFVFGNEAVRKYNKNYSGDFLPGTVGVVGLIESEWLYYGYIGDCYGRVLENEKVTVFTKCQTEKMEKHKKEFSLYEIRNNICNNKKHPYSYGVINGKKEAMDFVEMGKVNLRSIEKIILSSDGLEPYLSSLEPADFVDIDSNSCLMKSIDAMQKEDDKSIIVITKYNG